MTGCQPQPTQEIEETRLIWEAQESGTSAGIRGLSVVSDAVAWASGSDGTYLRTTNGGENWESATIPNASELDFRDIEAFDAEAALVLSAGEPATVFKTTDAGGSWTKQYRNDTPGVFFDSMAFWDAETGVAFSDPVEGSFLIIKTTDGGTTWEPLPSGNLPPPAVGEAGFAASGTSIAVQGMTHAWIGTGGSAARVLRTTDQGRTWSAAETPIRSGQPSTGIFSVAFLDDTSGVIVGGDYQSPENRAANSARTTDGGLTWTLVLEPPLGYRSSVTYVPKAATPTLVAVGTSGSDISTDGGRTWSHLGSVGYNVVGFAPSGSIGWAAGADGRIVKITPTR
jgi:photosystem II stability/assembly factor-like uncharacterized protein